MLKKIIMWIFICALAFSPALSWAGGGPVTNGELAMEIKALKARISELESRLDEQEEMMDMQEEAIESTRESLIKYVPGEGVEVAGLSIGASATFVLQGTPNANNAGDGEDSIFDASWSSDLEIEKEFSDWGLAFMHLEAGQNDGIEGELSLFSNVNRDAGGTGANVQVTELWYEHYFFDKQIALTAGKIDATCYLDQNEYANDETTQFLGHIFRNSPAIEWPADNNLGAHVNVCVEPIQFLEFDLGHFEGDGDWDDIFDHGVYTVQVNVKPAEFLDIDPEQWAGNYRFYFWMNDQFHTKLVDEGEPASDETKEMNYGFGISCDQMITDVFGVFGRFGWQGPDIIPVNGDPTLEWAWSTGAQMTGSYWNREDDVLAFAIGQVFPSKEYKDAGNAGSGEGHIEAYYKWQVNECLAISPDIQVIWNPNGVSKSSQGDNDTIFVYGMRGQIDF